jgi:hypothetical protein
VKSKRNVYGVLVEKPAGKRPLGSPRSKLQDNIKIDLAEIGWEHVDSINVAQGRNKAFVATVMNLEFP